MVSCIHVFLLNLGLYIFQTLRGHRLILAMSSPVFEAMFYGGMAEKSDKPIEILDVQPEAFKALLQ